MKRVIKTASIIGLALMSLWVTLSASGSEIVANHDNKEALDKEKLRLMLTGKEKFWQSGDEVLIAVLKSNPNIDETLRKYSGMTSMKFRNHWQRMAFSGRGKMPMMFSTVEEIVEFVEKNQGAIGIVESDTNVNGLRRIDLGMLFQRTENTIVVASVE